MARKNDFGKFIIAAGEVASYVVCPEAWKLQQDGADVERSGSNAKAVAGRDQHEKWTDSLGEAQHLIKGIRFILYLLAMSVIILAISLST